MRRLPRKRLRAAVALVLLLRGALVHADDLPEGIENIEELDLESLLGTVTAVSRRAESVFTAPATVTLVDRERIRHSAATTVADLLRMVPGVQVVQSAPGTYLVSMRGTGGVTGNNIVVLVDGIPINARIDASVDWAAIPIDPLQIQRIEVVRGPVSTIYGANAYTGVINIVSVPPSDRFGGAAGVTAGSDLAGKPIATGAGSLGGTNGRLHWRLNANGRFDQTFATAGAALQPALRMAGGLGVARFEMNRNATISLEIGGSYHQGSALDHLVLEPLPQRNGFAFGTLRLDLRELPSVLDSVAIWTRGKLVQTTGSPLARGFTNDGAKSLDGEAGLDVTFDLPKKLTVGLGGNAGVSRVDTPFLHPLENAKLRGQYGFYLNASIDLFQHLTISAAGRGDISALIGSLLFSYRGSIIYRAKSASIRLSGGTAFREPTYVEVAGRFIDPQSRLILLEGTPGLQPPRTDSVELGVIVVIAQRLTLKPTIYFQRLSNLMIEDFAPLTRKSFRNAPEERLVAGGELDAELRVARELAIEASVAGLWFLTEVTGTPPTLGVPEQNSAVTAWLGAHGKLIDDRLGLALGVNYASPRHYSIRAGIPPSLLVGDTPHLFRLEAAIDFQPSPTFPARFSVKAYSYLPNGRVESPFPAAGQMGTTILGSIDVRAE